MLYLTRKIGEAIIINDVIEVTLIEIQGKNIKLGFQFPDTEKVLRRELYDKIKSEIQSASTDILAIQQALFQGSSLSNDPTVINVPTNEELTLCVSDHTDTHTQSVK